MRNSDTNADSRRTLTLIFFVPGMGMKSSPCARIQASATWPAVASWRAPMALSPSATLRTFGKFSAEYFGTRRLKSLASKASGERCV